MFLNFKKPMIIKNCILLKISPRKEFHLGRVICLSSLNNLDSLTLVINAADKSMFSKFENQVRKALPEGTFLNSPIANNIVTCKIPKSRGIVQTEKINSHTNNEDENKYASVDLYIDNFYSFQNNKKNYFYKIKISRIEFIS